MTWRAHLVGRGPLQLLLKLLDLLLGGLTALLQGGFGDLDTIQRLSCEARADPLHDVQCDSLSDLLFGSVSGLGPPVLGSQHELLERQCRSVSTDAGHS